MKVAVFCGSAAGHEPVFIEATRALGRHFVQQGIDVVYGGGHVGLMGAIADSVMQAGGRVYGVMPKHLVDREIAHQGLTELTVVKDMHERKAAMADMADAFVALPGGAGTLEEIFEVWTWAQLGHHQKPCAFYNVEGFYEPLFGMIEQMMKTGFLKNAYADMLIRTADPQALTDAFRHYQAPQNKWG